MHNGYGDEATPPFASDDFFDRLLAILRESVEMMKHAMENHSDNTKIAGARDYFVNNVVDTLVSHEQNITTDIIGRDGKVDDVVLTFTHSGGRSSLKGEVAATKRTIDPSTCNPNIERSVDKARDAAIEAVVGKIEDRIGDIAAHIEAARSVSGTDLSLARIEGASAASGRRRGFAYKDM
jgi:hypothetical protein